MKKTLPLIIGSLVGLFAVAEFYVPWYGVSLVMEELLAIGLILAAAAFVLGGINVLQVNWPKIRRREADWHYKVLLLASTALMAVVGFEWHRVGADPVAGVAVVYRADDPAAAPAIRVLATRAEATIQIGAQTVRGGERVEVEPGVKISVSAAMPTAGYGRYGGEVTLAAGEVALIGTDQHLEWGISGRVFTWIYDHAFDPCNSTMFSLLAFFIASAAFRAFRARNIEAALLLGAAIIIMLGTIPMGRAISESFPALSDWILDIPNNAGRRAIMMGAALGAIATGLRIILGLERSHLGAE